MIPFSDIRQETIAGTLLRFPLRFLPRDIPVRILQGKLMGKKWIVGSHKHGCCLGSDAGPCETPERPGRPSGNSRING